MAGEAGKDGTFFDADAAVKAGIIPAGNILATTPQLRDKVRVELSGLENMADIRTMMGHISVPRHKPSTLKINPPIKPSLNLIKPQKRTK